MLTSLREFSFCVILACSSTAYSQVYGELALGLSKISIENGSQGLQDISIGNFFRLGGGFAANHTFKLGMSLRTWAINDEDSDNDGVDDELLEHFLFHDFHFSSLSLGIDVLAYLPTLNKGAYIRYGRHCWAAEVFDYQDNFFNDSCGNVFSVGYQNELVPSLFLEIEITDFEFANSLVGVVGARF